MPNEKVYDILGIGIGPFNLGLAALCDSLPELQCLFIDQNEDFNWHPGLLLPGTRLQVPFYSDLTTLADPQSKFGYMVFVKAKSRLFRFAIRENYFTKRTDYNEYCQWVAGQLPSLQFSCQCRAIEFDKNKLCYKVITTQQTYFGKHIVIGIGTSAYFPAFAKNIHHPLLLHSGEYLFRKEKLLNQKRISLIGSGQSAAEIFYDLLQCYEGELKWFTRSDSFFPMDYSKFALEKTSADYIDHFFSLPDAIKPVVLSNQDRLFKGINMELISAIYDSLDDKQPVQAQLHPNCELQHISGEFDLHFFHRELQESFVHKTDAVILATGYQSVIPGFIEPIRQHIQCNDKDQYRVNRNYSIDNNNRLFVQNADLHSHGFNAADLGMGPHRNSVILNTILGYEHFTIERNITFQNFGLPLHCH